MTSQNHHWFNRHADWRGVTFYWPCHWIGALLMIVAICLALTLTILVVEAAQAAGHPALGWLSVIAVGIVYGGFDRMADRHARR